MSIPKLVNLISASQPIRMQHAWTSQRHAGKTLCYCLRTFCCLLTLICSYVSLLPILSTEMEVLVHLFHLTVVGGECFWRQTWVCIQTDRKRIEKHLQLKRWMFGRSWLAATTISQFHKCHSHCYALPLLLWIRQMRCDHGVLLPYCLIFYIFSYNQILYIYSLRLSKVHRVQTVSPGALRSLNMFHL